MSIKNNLYVETILAEPTWHHLCFAEQDAGEAAGAGAEPEAPAGETEGEELDLEDDGAPPPEETDELEIGPDKIKVPKKVKEAWSGLQAKTQAEREDLKARAAKVAERETRFAEVEKIHAALIDDVTEIKGAERQIKSIDERLEPYLKLSAADWMAWGQQEPEKAQQAQRGVQALQMERAGLETARTKAIQAAQTKAQEYQNKQAALTEENKQAAVVRQAQAEKELSVRIKDWSPAKKEQLSKYASDNCISPEELTGIASDWRAWMFLDKAARYDAAVAKSRAVKAAAAQAEMDSRPAPEPLPKMRTAGATAALSTPRDSDSPEAWLKKRNAQLARRRGR